MNANLTRRTLLGAVATAIAAPAIARQRQQPNILFIMADDLGYADLSCYGRRDYATPQIDRLAAQGMRFTAAYANSPVCSATRTALMTGRYQYRLPIGLEEPLAFRDVGLSPDEPTLPSVLGKAGYATALVGKWHLGMLPRFSPLNSGYDHFWGIHGGGADYFTHRSGAGPDLWDGKQSISQSGYLTDLLADRAIQQLRSFAADQRPFFMSLHFTAPHWPWEGPEDAVEAQRIADKGDSAAIFHYDGGTLATYAAMMKRLDQQVGRVLDALRRLRLDDDTIVIFTSDNGGERFSDTWPFSGRKTELLEGGIRIPLIVRWPGTVRAGTESHEQVMTMDWVPTLAGAAGTLPPALRPPDGIDIRSALAGGQLPLRPLFWRYRHLDQRACLHGRHKYLVIDGNEFLFDVVADPLERGNLKEREAQRFASLKAQWGDWNKTMLPFDPESFSHGFRGRDVADRFGVD